MTQSPSGTPGPEEYFTYVIKLAHLSVEAFRDAQLMREEVRSALKTFEQKNDSIATRTKDIQDSYAPASVQNAVDAAETVLVRFGGESRNVLEQLTKLADRVSRTLLMRTVLWVVATSMCLVFVAWLATPNIAIIADRRAELQSLQGQVSAANSHLEGLKDHLVSTNGRSYVRYKNTVTICLVPDRVETCGPYVQVR